MRRGIADFYRISDGYASRYYTDLYKGVDFNHGRTSKVDITKNGVRLLPPSP